MEDKDIPLGSGTTFRELLDRQLALLEATPATRALAEHLIGHLDDDGYLRRDLESIVNDLAFTQGIEVEKEALEEALGLVQTLDPAGVGARDLKECLLLQVSRKQDEKAESDPRQVSLARAASILTAHYDAFVKKHFAKMQLALDLGEDELRDAMEELTRLNPKPGNSGSESSRVRCTTSFQTFLVVGGRGGHVVFQLNGRNAPELRVSRTYQRNDGHLRPREASRTRPPRRPSRLSSRRSMRPSGLWTPLCSAKGSTP